MSRLTAGWSPLLAGSIADLVGNRPVNPIGCILLGSLNLASALAQNDIQIIFSRGYQGMAASMCLPTAVRILTIAFPNGTRHNIGFACLVEGQLLE